MKKKRRKIVGLMIAGILVLVLSLVSTPAPAKFILDVGYYSPAFGKINDFFDEQNDSLGTNWQFESGMMYGLALEYDASSHFRLRLEHSAFESQTSSSWWDPGQKHSLLYKLTVNSVVLSGNYKFSPFYIGAGVGSFSTEFIYALTEEILGYSRSKSGSDNDSPAGFVVLAGLEFGDKPIFLNLELRYIVNAKAKLELDDWLNTKVDLSGLQFSLLVGFKA